MHDEEGKTRVQVAPESVELRQLSKGAIIGRRTWLLVVCMSVLLCVLVWLDEILDLPHLLLGVPQTPINWGESIIETVLVVAVGSFTALSLIRDLAERKQAEAEMGLERDKFQGLLAAIGDGVDVVTQDYRVMYVNDNLKEIIGKDELVGYLCYEVFLDRDAPCERCPMRRAIERGRTETEEIIQPNGKIVELSSSPLRLPTGEMAAVEIAKDITERKWAQEALRQSRERLELQYRLSQHLSESLDLRDLAQRALDDVCAVVGALRGILLVCDPDSDRLRLVAVSGYDAESVEMLDRRIRLHVGNGLAGCVAAQRQPASVDDVTQDQRWLPVPGLDDWVRSALSVPLLNRDELVGVFTIYSEQGGFFRDDHHRLAESAAAAVAAAIANARLYEQAQQRLQSLTNLNRASQVLASRLDVEEVLEQIVDLMGSVVNSDYTSVVLLDEEGEPVQGAEDFRGVPSVVRRIRAGGITHHVLDGGQSVVVDAISDEGTMSPPLLWPNGEVMEANSAIVTAGIRSFAAVPIQARGRMLGVLFVHSREPGAFRGQLPLLTTFANQAAIAIENARLYEQAQQEIAERKRTEEELRQLKEFNEGIVQNMTEGIAVEDAEGYFTFVNPAAATLLGYALEELVGQHWTTVAPPDQQPIVRAADERRMRGEADQYELELVRQDGQRLSVLISGSPRFEGECFAGTLAVFTDITERKRVEEQLCQQERLAAVGQLAAGIAHDFNNLLTGIIGFAELLQRRADVPESAKTDLARIVQEGRRAAHLIRQILDFSRRSIRAPYVFDLATFLTEATRFLQRTIPESTRIVLEITPGYYMVNADPAQVQQVLTNLAVNAHDAMPEGGELRFCLSGLSLQPGVPVPSTDMSPGEWVVLSVADTGAGIPPEVMPHLFEPFFTTKEVGKGTGLGLAQVYGIVRQHDGYIEVDSQVGKGTTVCVYFPAVRGKDPIAAEPLVEEIPPGQGETILLVEDESTVLDAIRELLVQLGYRVRTAVNGQEALAVYARHRTEIALVLTDMIMPEMDGLALLRALWAQDPGVKAVVTTGYPLGDEYEQLMALGIVGWIQKPLDEARLAQVLRQALGER